MSEASKNMVAAGDNELIAVGDDELIFAEEGEEEEKPIEASWKILIVDDEIEIHNITKLALNEFTFENKPIAFISAFSGKEAKEMIQAHPDIALILLDVVMETEGAGLEVVKYIRDILNNQVVRIILRTGQPGQVPEDVVIVSYDINDYHGSNSIKSISRPDSNRSQQKRTRKNCNSFRPLCPPRIFKVSQN
jgi:adenylate cyclase